MKPLHRIAMRYLLLLWSLILIGPSPAISEPMPVVASFSIIADLVEQIGGSRLKVTSLIPRATDPHVFQASPQDAQRLQSARLIFVNGLGLEGSIDRLIASTGQNSKRVVVSATIKPFRLIENGRDQGLDPHAWHDVANTKLYVEAICAALIKADPDGRSVYESRTQTYQKALDELDIAIKQGLAAIPPSQRMIVTNHDAFGYFARAYQIDMIAARGVSTETEPSARDIARVIRQIRSQKIPAVFLENVADPRLMQQIAQETGAKIGDKLFTDSLSVENGAAPTYIDMMRANLARISKALLPSP